MTRTPVVVAYLACIVVGLAFTAVGISGWWTVTGFGLWYALRWARG